VGQGGRVKLDGVRLGVGGTQRWEKAPGKTDPRLEIRTEQPEFISKLTSKMRPTNFGLNTEVTRPVTEPNLRFNMNQNDPHPK